MGAPGAGKGTQARLLQERLNLPQISTGDIFRALKDSHTSLAQEVRDIMAKGHLVPDELTIRLVRERTSEDDCRNGYILDGFPRTPAQAASLEELAQEQGNQIVPVLIDTARDLLERRMTGRRNCPVCTGRCAPGPRSPATGAAMKRMPPASSAADGQHRGHVHSCSFYNQRTGDSSNDRLRDTRYHDIARAAQFYDALLGDIGAKR